MPSQAITPKGRVSFPNVFTQMKFQGEEKGYGLTLLFPKDTDLSALKKIAQAAAEKKWGKAIPKGLKTPFRDGDEKDRPEYAGHIFVSFKRRTEDGQPEVVDQRGAPILSASEFYAGCYARCGVNAYAYDTNGNRGVAFALNTVQKLADGEPFGTGPVRASDDFETVAAEAAAGEGASDENMF